LAKIYPETKCPFPQGAGFSYVRPFKNFQYEQDNQHNARERQLPSPNVEILDGGEAKKEGRERFFVKKYANSKINS